MHATTARRLHRLRGARAVIFTALRGVNVGEQMDLGLTGINAVVAAFFPPPAASRVTGVTAQVDGGMCRGLM
jgi:hypothetical protein